MSVDTPNVTSRPAARGPTRNAAHGTFALNEVPTARLGVPTGRQKKLQEFAQLFDRKASITRDINYGDGGVVMTGENSRPGRHGDVLALTKDNEAHLFERPIRIKMIDARIWARLGRDFENPSTFAPKLLVDG